MNREWKELQESLKSVMTEAGIDQSEWSIEEARQNVINLSLTPSGYEVWKQTDDGHLLLKTFSDPYKAIRCFLKHLTAADQAEQILSQLRAEVHKQGSGHEVR